MNNQATISLVGAASYIPDNVITNDFFNMRPGALRHPMFRGSVERRHVSPNESAVDMIENACSNLKAKLNLDYAKDVDIIITNVTVMDQPFTGCGANIAHRIGATNTEWIIDQHNAGCISFVYMMDVARALMAGSNAKTALIINVQNSGGKIFSHDENRKLPQSSIPGDGCGVGYLIKNEESPVLSIVKKSYGEYAEDMNVVSPDGQPWYAPRTTPVHIEFTEKKLAKVVGRGNRIAPDALYSAIKQANLSVEQIDKLITNQPNPIFLRNWREAISLEEEAHIHTFPRHGNLFGAALPISLEEAVNTDRLKKGEYLLMGGFAHAGDYGAAAVIHWQAGAA